MIAVKSDVRPTLVRYCATASRELLLTAAMVRPATFDDLRKGAVWPGHAVNSRLIVSQTVVNHWRAWATYCALVGDPSRAVYRNRLASFPIRSNTGCGVPLICTTCCTIG